MFVTCFILSFPLSISVCSAQSMNTHVLDHMEFCLNK